MRRVDYDERQYDVFVKGRSLSPERMAVWVDAFTRHFPPQRPLVIAVVDTPTALGTDVAMLRRRALSTFEHLDEDEIEHGLAAIAAAIAGREDEPVRLPGDVLVFTRP